MKKKLIVLQESSKDCGACCLLSIIRYYEGNISLNRLVEMTKTTREGTNFFNIKRAAESIGIDAKGYLIDKNYCLQSIHCPALCQVISNGYTHFVIIYSVNSNDIIIMDPAVGRRKMPREDFAKIWTGNIMIFEPRTKIPFFKDSKFLNKLIVELLIKNKKTIIYIFVLSILFVILSCFNSFYLKIFIDRIGLIDKNVLIVVSLIFLIIVILRSFINLFRNYLLFFINQKIDVSLFINSFRQILFLPYQYFKSRTTGDVVTRINDLGYVKAIISKITITVLLDSVLAFASLFVLFYLNYLMALGCLIIVVLYFLILIIFKPFVKNKVNQNQEDSAYLNSCLVESITGFETLKGLNVEKNISDKLGSLYIKSQKNIFNFNIVSNMQSFFKELVYSVGFLIINYLGISFVLNSTMTIGTLVTFNSIFVYLITPVDNIIDLQNEYYYAINSIKRANSLYDIKGEDLISGNSISLNGNIIFDDVSYSYNGITSVLSNVNLSINDGDRVLILGKSGSGKSTLLKLLYKYYDIGRNKILVNNYDINDCAKKDIRELFCYVSQNEILYTDSIRNNIILSRNVTDEAFLHVCELTGVLDIVSKNIVGYDMLLQENGNNISGGERQRIILARSLLKKSKIILIDEGLNQLDVGLERMILKKIFEFYHDRTFIIVSHRMNNMDLYSKVYKMENGNVYKDLEVVK